MVDGDKIVVTSGWSGGKAIDDIEVFKYNRDKDTLCIFEAKNENLPEEDALFLNSLSNLQVKRNRPTSIAL